MILKRKNPFLMIMNDTDKKALKFYVQECGGYKDVATCTTGWSVTNIPMVVWRGQSEEFEELPKHFPIFSTTKKKEVAITQFIGERKSCCLFKIQVQPGTKYMDVNQLLGDHSKKDEYEIIVPGNLVSIFQGTTVENGLSIYHYKYGPNVAPVVKELTAQDLFATVDSDEIELFDQPHEIRGYETLSKAEQGNFNILFRAAKQPQQAGRLLHRKRNQNGKKQQKVGVTPTMLRRHTWKSKSKHVTKTAKTRLKNRKNH